MCFSENPGDRPEENSDKSRTAVKKGLENGGIRSCWKTAALLAVFVVIGLCSFGLIRTGFRLAEGYPPVYWPHPWAVGVVLTFFASLVGGFIAMGRLFWLASKSHIPAPCAAGPLPGPLTLCTTGPEAGFSTRADGGPQPNAPLPPRADAVEAGDAAERRAPAGAPPSSPAPSAAVSAAAQGSASSASTAATPTPDTAPPAAEAASASAAIPTSTSAGGPPKRQPRQYDRADTVFALCAFLLGYLFLRLVTIFYAGAGVTLFAALYAALVLGYAHCAGVKPSRASWGWLAFFLAMALLFFVGIATPLRLPALFFLAGVAVYWTLAVFGARLSGRVNGCLGGDLRNAFWWAPFGNFSALPGALGHSLKRRGGGQKRREDTAPAVLLGAVLTLFLLPLVLLLLASADASFERALSAMFGWIDFDFPAVFLRLVLAVPVSFYLFGLFWGARRRTGLRGSAEKLRQAAEKRRSLGFAAAGIPIAALLAVYLIFFIAQLPYFISAFAGLLPGGFTYAEYARRGFFELLWVAAINLLLLFFTKRRVRPGGRARRVLAALLCGATLLLLGTAARKLGLYIGIFGLTRKRVWAAWAMVLVAVVVVLALVEEFWRLPLARALALVCCGWFFLLCAVNVDGLVVRYNYAAWQAGRIEEMDAAAPEPVFAAGALYEVGCSTADEDLRQRCEEALRDADYSEQWRAESGHQVTGFTLAGLRAARLAREAGASASVTNW